MPRTYRVALLKFTFVPAFLASVLLSLHTALAADKITSVHLDKGDIVGITRVTLRKDGKIGIYSGSTMKIVEPAKLPPGFLASWGINTDTVATTAEQASVRSIDRGVTNGKFRVVDGVVYDIRGSQPGWIYFPKVSLEMKLEDDEAILNTTPDLPDSTEIHVLHLSKINSYNETNPFKYTGLRKGSTTFKTKSGELLTIPTYDAGRPAKREELPDAIVKEGKPSAPLAGGVEPPQTASAPKKPHVPELYCSGTAFFITSDGFLITNDHVVNEVDKVRVKIGPKYFDAKVVKTDHKLDLALLKVEGTSYAALPLAGKKDPELGADVFTIGFPNIDVQGFEPKYTDGRISSLSGLHDDPSRFQVTVPVQPGNSGGPLINRYGAVDGVMVGTLRADYMMEESGVVPQNVNYAIKTSTLRDFLTPIHELDGKLIPQTGSRKHADVMKRAQEAVVTVLGYK